MALTKVVASAMPFHCTTELLMNLVPVAVSVNVAPPAAADDGEIADRAGSGFVVAALMVNVSGVDVPPPGVGVNTVTEAVPAVAMSPAGTAAVNCVALPKVVVRAVPFHCTTDVLMKFVPVKVNMKAGPPAVAEVGD